MNDYPIWWDSTITLYNQYEDPITNVIKWYRTVLTNCFWKNDSNRMTVGDTVISGNSTICRIPKNSNYLARIDWVALPNESMGDYFTLGRGDIIICGQVDDDIDEYVKGKHSTDLLNKYKELLECLTIESFTINIGQGRCNEHYYIRGN